MVSFKAPGGTKIHQLKYSVVLKTNYDTKPFRSYNWTAAKHSQTRIHPSAGGRGGIGDNNAYAGRMMARSSTTAITRVKTEVRVTFPLPDR